MREPSMTSQTKTAQSQNKLPKVPMNGTIINKDGMKSLELEVSRPDFTNLMNLYWLKVKSNLSQNTIAAATKGGFREVKMDRVISVAGGLSNFMLPVTTELIDTYVSEDSPEEALVVGRPTVIEGIHKFTIVASLETVPAVTWKSSIPGIDAPLKVKIPRLPNAADKIADEEMEAARSKSVNLDPVLNDDSPVEGQVVGVDVRSSIEGVIWEEGCSTAKKWPMDKTHFKIGELYDALLSMKPGETRHLTFTLTDKFGDKAGKVVDAQLHLIQVFNKTLPAKDDDLAKTAGFSSIEAWREQLVKDANYNIAETRMTLIDNAIMSQIINSEVVHVDAIPQVWMVNKAREMYTQAVDTTRGDESEVIRQFTAAKLTTISGSEVNDKNSILLFLAEKAAQQLAVDLVLKSWGEKKGIDGYSTLDKLPEYVDKVKSTLKAVVDVEEYDVTEEDVKNGSI